MKVNVPPPPQKLFRQFEAGEITRAELQATCALHQREMIAEIEEMRRNPVAAYVEDLLIKREAGKIRRQHGEGLPREIFAALAEVPDFPPAILLWNADHRDVPFHCFFRFRREPVFRLLAMRNNGLSVTAEVEYGSSDRKLATRETFTLHRGIGDRFVVTKRKMGSA
ncbi:hypothetical protein AAFN60_02830 [Roseibacillus persicicus]|uniref:Uncharacterized protein n=1 Tax=Roseibacillus persicicus TaxID=454148 RepID=A0A918TMC7_9BACT|nr:hypothetical protein [Roseibacillus persicicus]GHC54446.1 hypothetical protein GCM10007100_21080 [Roseibacillus persicicus]